MDEEHGGGGEQGGVAQEEKAEIGGRIFFAEASAGDVQPAAFDLDQAHALPTAMRNIALMPSSAVAAPSARRRRKSAKAAATSSHGR